MLTVWGYAFLFFFDEFVFEESRNAISDFHFASNEVSLYIKKLEFAIIVTPVVILVFFSYCIFRKRSSYIMIFATVLFIFVMLYGFGIISLMIYEFCKNNKS